MMARSIHTRTLGLGCSLLAIALCATPSFAQDATSGETASSGGLEEIVVTARKREENAQTTPLSISAFNASSLAERGVQKASDITSFVPNVQFDSAASESGGGASSQIAIRGIGQTDYVLTVEPGVGIYLDGVYVGKSIGSLFEAPDIARIEVLRGPQGTLFGRNTIGGAIQIVSRPPSKTPDFFVETSAGSYGRLDVKTSFSAPINDALRIRASGAFISRDGYIKRLDVDGNDTGKRDGDQDRLIGRLVAELDVTPNLKATLALDGTHVREKSAGGVQVDVYNGAGTFAAAFNAGVPGGCSAAYPGVAPYCYTSTYVQPLKSLQTYTQYESRSNVDVWGAALTLDWDMGNMAIKSISAYRNVEADIAHDLSGSPYYVNAIQQQISTEQYSQELQLTGKALANRLNYVFGLFYLREQGRQVFPVYNSEVQFNSGGDIKNDSYAAFGQLTYEINDVFSVTGGLRYTGETRVFNPGLQEILSYTSNPGVEIPGWVNVVSGAFGPPGTAIFPAGNYKRKSSAVTPMLTVNAQITPDVMAYASYSKGFKGGGFVMRYFPPVIPAAGTDPDSLIGYAGPEKATTYEVGVKSEFLDRKVRLNIAGFYTEYNGVQITYNTDPFNTGVPFVPTLANAGNAHIKGLEVETSLVPTDWLRIDGSLGYIDAKYVSIDPAVVASSPTYADAINFSLPNTPKWTANIGATLTFFDNDSGKAFVRGDYSYRSTQAKDFSNTSSLIQPAYSLVNASVTYRTADKHWEVSAGGTNLTDKIYIVSGMSIPALGVSQAVPSRPREWFLRLRYEY